MEDSDDDEEQDEEEDNAIPWVELPELGGALVARYEPEAVRARLRQTAAGEGFRAVVAELAVRCGSTPQPMPDGAGFSLQVVAAGALDLEALQSELRPRGVLVLGGGASGGEPVLTLLPTTDPLEALAAWGVAAPSHGVSSRHVVEFFRTHPAVLTEIGADTVAGRFEPLPENAWALAVEVYNLCPGVVEQDEGGFEGLIAMLERSGAFCLRWG